MKNNNQPETSFKHLELKTASDLRHVCLEVLKATKPYFKEGQTGLTLGHTTTHYGQEVAKMEAFSRMLWALYPMLVNHQQDVEENLDFLEQFYEVIRKGCDPDDAGFWGNIEPFDQREVEMAAYGFAMTLLGERFWAPFDDKAQKNIHQWLNQSAFAEIPDNNWHYFPIMVQLGFYCSGKEYNKESIDFHFDKMEQYYLGDGWYSDGIDRPKDYYISMGFHFYGLIYAKKMADVDPERSKIIIERAKLFAQDFIYMFSQKGDAIAFGRSLCYRFAEVAFWSAVAFVDADIMDLGIVKGLILRHLRHWFKQPIFDASGILTIGYHYPNLIMAEDYNAPGSPYWGFKVMLPLALQEDHPFWTTEEKPLQSIIDNKQRVITHAQQIIRHNNDSSHAWMMTSGQLEKNNYVNTESKYTKFAYSNLFGFTLERGRYQLKHNACDSMLLLGEGDGYYRGRRECTKVTVGDFWIYSQWSPYNDVDINTYLIVVENWQLRVHIIDTQRDLEAVEGGFSILNDNSLNINENNHGILLKRSDNDQPLYSSIYSLGLEPEAVETVITPPNSNILYPERCAIPTLHYKLPSGHHVLSCAILAGNDEMVGAISPDNMPNIDLPSINVSETEIKVCYQQKEWKIAIQ